MPDFNVRSDSVNVEQVMEQIRARIREKRGVDYTEEQIRELAAVKLEKFLDPRGVRSDLLTEFRKRQPVPYSAPLYDFEEDTLFDSHRGIVRFLRRLFRPLFKLVFNANALSQSLHHQAEINRHTFAQIERVRESGDLYYELLHNLVVELTRTTIEVKNMKMRVESLASRLEFNERRARALESVVVYKPADEDVRGGRRPPEARPVQEPRPQAAQPAPVAAGTSSSPDAPAAAATGGGEGPGQRSRRRRRRRGRRGGASAVTMMTDAGGGGAAPHERDDVSAAASAPPTAAAGEASRPEPSQSEDGRAEPREPAGGESGDRAPDSGDQ